MQRLTGQSLLEGVLIDWSIDQSVAQPRLPVSWLTLEQKAAALARIQRNRAQDTAWEADLILGVAEDCPDDDDPKPGTPGARKGNWRKTDPEFPGVSEFFVDEVAHAINLGRGTAAFRAHRAWTWRENLPATFAALRRGDIDERRAGVLADVLQHSRPELAQAVETAVLPEACTLSLRRLDAWARELLLELDSASAEENRERAQQAADVFVQPAAQGMATLGADLPADEAAEAYDLIDQLAQMAKADGDPRPICQIRTEVYSLLLRRPGGTGQAGVTAKLTITAALASLEGTSSVPGDVNGFPITPQHLRDLLRRVGALGLQAPEDGTLTFALTDENGRLIATVSVAELAQLARRGEGLNPPPATDRYEPTDRQRVQVKTRDRTCRMPNCGQRVGWADLDHVVPHACGGETTCTNLCCLCRHDHRLKTFARGWLFVMDPDGTLHVTSPAGITRTTRPPGLRPPVLGPRPDPTDDSPPF